MKCKTKMRISTLMLLPALLLGSLTHLWAQAEKVAALKQSIAENQKKLMQFTWMETTIISMKGEEKSRTQKECHYGPDGKVMKQPLSAPPPQQAARGLKGKAIAKKKEEISDYMKQAVALVQQYVPPDSQRIQALKDAGKISFTPGPGGLRMDFSDYLKAGDVLSISVNSANNSIAKVAIKSYLDSPSDAVNLDVTYDSLPDGTNHPSQTVLQAPAKNIEVVVKNEYYRK